MTLLRALLCRSCLAGKLAALCLAGVLVAVSGERPGNATLAAALQSAFNASDPAALDALVYWEGVDPADRAAFLGRAAAQFGHPVERVEFEPLHRDEVLGYTRDGLAYRPNLRPTGWMVLRFRGPPGASGPRVPARFIVGAYRGKPRIAALVSGSG